jgi:hypothetical protein
MVLISDVHIHACENVVTNIDAIVTNDRAPPSYQASVPDYDYGVSHHFLSGHHARRQSHLTGNHRVIADAYPSLPVHVSRRPIND